jgi:ketosteroid isomerase-like protein
VRWLLVLALVLGCAAPQHEFTANDDRWIRDVLALQAEAWNRGDLDGYMKGYERSEKLVFTSGGNIRHGYVETLQKYKQKYGGAKSTMGTLAFEILSIQRLGADAAIVLGRWKLTATPNAGSGVFSVAFLRTEEGWRIVHDHTSVDTGPPPPEPEPEPEPKLD